MQFVNIILAISLLGHSHFLSPQPDTAYEEGISLQQTSNQRNKSSPQYCPSISLLVSKCKGAGVGWGGGSGEMEKQVYRLMEGVYAVRHVGAFGNPNLRAFGMRAALQCALISVWLPFQAEAVQYGRLLLPEPRMEGRSKFFSQETDFNAQLTTRVTTRRKKLIHRFHIISVIH